MRRVLSWAAIVLIGAAFITLCLVFPLKLHIAVPIVLFVLGIILFFVVRRMEPDDAGTGESGGTDRSDSEDRR